MAIKMISELCDTKNMTCQVYSTECHYCDDDGGSIVVGVVDHQLKRSLTAGFSVSRGSVQNGHRDVRSLDRCGICTDAQYLHTQRERVRITVHVFSVCQQYRETYRC